MYSHSALFPLYAVEGENLQRLARILWNWQACDSCKAQSPCRESRCPWNREKKLDVFWSSYKEDTSHYVPEFLTSRPLLATHDDLLDLMETIKKNWKVTRSVLTKQLHAQRNTRPDDWAAASDQDRALSLAASTLLLARIGASQPTDATLEEGSRFFPWRDFQPIKQLIGEVFPERLSYDFDSQDSNSMRMLSADQLRRKAGIAFEAKTDLRSHLAFDPTSKVLSVFNGTAVLKEMLLASLDDPDACLLPRALMLEVLHTIYHVLFPSDVRSQALLESLIRKRGLDQDLQQFETPPYRDGESTEIQFVYFEKHLAKLRDELRNPSPRTRLEHWFEKNSGARCMLMVTMIGFIITVLLGILGLGVSVFQAWVSWQQWKHPVDQS